MSEPEQPTDALRLRFYLAGVMTDETWVSLGDPQPAVAAGEYHAQLAAEADTAGIPWFVEVFDPDLPEDEAYRRFGTDTTGMVLPMLNPDGPVIRPESWRLGGRRYPPMARLALVLLIVLAAAACGSTAAVSTTTPTVSPVTALPTSSAATLGCAWYTALAPPGQAVNITATGPACRDRSLIDWLTSDSDRPWTTEGVIPGSFGHLLATLARNGSTVQVWFTGPEPSPTTSAGHPTQTSPPAAVLAGQLADALAAAGWRPAP